MAYNLFMDIVVIPDLILIGLDLDLSKISYESTVAMVVAIQNSLGYARSLSHSTTRKMISSSGASLRKWQFRNHA